MERVDGMLADDGRTDVCYARYDTCDQEARLLLTRHLTRHHLQQTETEDDRHTEPLLPTHLQAPDDALREQKHGEIGGEMDGGRRNLKVEKVETLAIDGEVPNLGMRSALEAQREDDGDVGGDLDEDDGDTTPPEGVTRPVAARDEEPAPLYENGNLEEGEDEGIADTEDENPLVYVLARVSCPTRKKSLRC